MTETDVELMLRVRDGDPEAFRRVVEHHQRPLINFFYRLTWDRHQSEDLAQEVFLRLYRARASYSPQARFTTYMYRIARNLWIDRYRSRRASPGEVSLDREVAARADGIYVSRDHVAARGRSPAEEASGREMLGALKAAVARLPDDQRQVFVLGHLQGMPYATIGEVMDIPVGTVKSRMHAAVRRLRGLLGRVGDDLAG